MRTRVLVVSTYDLGRPPTEALAAADRLGAAGHDARVLDLAVDPWSDELAAWADRIVFSVPMHTALRLALTVAARLRTTRPHVPVAFLGMYAVLHDAALVSCSDARFGPESLDGLVAWVGPATADGPAGRVP